MCVCISTSWYPKPEGRFTELNYTTIGGIREKKRRERGESGRGGGRKGVTKRAISRSDCKSVGKFRNWKLIDFAWHCQELHRWNRSARTRRDGAGPNARPCTPTAGFSCRLRIVIAPHKTAARDYYSSPLGSPDWQMGRESCGMTNRSSRFQRMRRNYAPTDSSFRNPRGAARRNTSPSTVAVSRLGRREITAMKSVLSFYACVVSPRYMCYANAANQSTNSVQCSARETRAVTYTEITAVQQFLYEMFALYMTSSNCLHTVYTCIYTKRHLLFKILYTIPFPISKTCFL